MLSLTFAGLNPDILQANLNFSLSCCGATDTVLYTQIYSMKGILDAHLYILHYQNAYKSSKTTEKSLHKHKYVVLYY